MCTISAADAFSCTPDDFLCNAFPDPAPAKPQKPIGKPHPILDDVHPADPKLVDYLDTLAGKPTAMTPEKQRQFLTIVFAHFDELPSDWKRTVCKSSYPDAVRDGAIDVATHKNFYAKCEAFTASEVP